MGGPDALPDYELLELLLFLSIPQRDTKPLAKALIARFGSFADVIAATPERLSEVDGVKDVTVAALKTVAAAALRLAKARVIGRPVLSSWETLSRDFADMIQKGRSIKIAGDTRPGTVADLFEAYVAHLKASGKSSWKEAEKGFNKIADTLGRNRHARDIEPDEITNLIRPIYGRGKRSMADHVRSYIRSAYSWGLKSEHDYRSTTQRHFRLVYNPAAGIPTEPKKVGTR